MRSDDAEDLFLLNLERDAVDRNLVTVEDLEVGDCNRGRHESWRAISLLSASISARNVARPLAVALTQVRGRFLT